MRAHAPPRRVRLPAQWTLKLLNTCTESKCQKSTDVNWVGTCFMLFGAIRGKQAHVLC